MSGNELLSCAQVYQADALALEAGKSGQVLMENAGRGIAREILARFDPRPTTILCGPGGNGGDGFVVARVLREAGWPVRVGCLGDRDALKDDAASMASAWKGEIEGFSADLLQGCDLVVDGIFGAGISRDVGGIAQGLIEEINDRQLACVAIDIPSGVHGDSGAILATAPRAILTVTFFRKKPGHLLMPGREYCGETTVIDIGISANVLGHIEPLGRENGPDIWGRRFPWPKADAHKYDRGHAVVVSGSLGKGGAARLAARGALRVGAGLVTIACPPDGLIEHAAHVNAIMSSAFNDLDEILIDERKNAVLLGPGCGIGEKTRTDVLTALRGRDRCVVDADGLSSFEHHPEALFDGLGPQCILTPHEGEFRRLFPDLGRGDKPSRALAAAERAGAVIVLKGADTVIAKPCGAYVINSLASPFLATAGSGDVLAGLLVGLLAQGVDAFDAACAGAWLHGAAACRFGPGLIAEDITELLPAVLRELYENI